LTVMERQNGSVSVQNESTQKEGERERKRRQISNKNMCLTKICE